MRIKKVQEIIPNMSTVIGADDTPNDKDVYSSNAVKSIINDSNTYSTNEKVIGAWIDGKPLYRKTINIGVINAGSNSINHNTENIASLIKIYGFGINGDNEFIPLPFPNKNGLTYTISMYATLSAIKIDCGTDISLSNTYATIEYTKTTD